MNRRAAPRLALIVGLGAWAAFALLAGLVAAGHGAPSALDRALLSWSVGHRPPAAVAVARVLTATGTGAVPYALAALAGLVAARTPRQRLPAALLGMVCLGAGQAVRYGVMDLVARARPPHAGWRTPASGWSFPSGHTTTAALAAGLLVLALCLRAPRGRTVLCGAAVCWAAAVGLTRVFLGVHWFTDVLGGWLFATGWLAVLLAAVTRRPPGRLLPAPGGATPPTPPDADGVAGTDGPGRGR
ncbi:phosphatase PAP2 family protein [Streptomyces sp. NPDC001606]